MYSSKNIIGVVGGLGNEAMVDLAMKMSVVPGHENNAYIFYGNSRLAYKPAEVGFDWLPTDIPELRKQATAVYTSRILQFLGCGVIGLACNSAHPLFREVITDIPVKFVDMIHETACFLKDEGEKILILGVSSLVESGLYQDALADNRVACVSPSLGNQKKIMSAIYDPCFGIKTAKITAQAKSLLCEVLMDEYENQGCRNVVLGCTELPLALTVESCNCFKKNGMIPQDMNVIDSSAILAEALVLTSGSEPTAPASINSYFSEYTDWFPPVTFQVDTLNEFVTIQSRIIRMTTDYLEKQGRKLEGSYMHIPVMCAVGNISGFVDMASCVTKNILDLEDDWERDVSNYFEEHFSSII
ncbi:aspartate/glutamate racemase family protein [Maridesulfovibrio zosterae]|uniref:aspartate/glutamate racemase family protein n=1 Tax=Maridesulfovibrio zosterae TaxID=82171 RepID=UPI0003F60AA4|nr:aspartate/glutamate racemase family protein [Maridesulfovibrio zosterae]